MHGLQGIPSSAFYRHNTDTVQNPQDSRAGGGRRVRVNVKPKTKRMRRRTRRSNGRRYKKSYSKSKTKSKTVNYAGRQIGHQHQRASQSGGVMLVPGDANLITSSIGSFLENGVATLRGTDPGDSPLPFADKVSSRNL